MESSLRQQTADEVLLDRLVRDWDFQPSTCSLYVRLARMRAVAVGLCPFPTSLALKPAIPRGRWSCYFVYLPDGRLTDAHRFTLERLRTLDAGLLVVCAARDPDAVPRELLDRADALYWKDLGGYDFSAYSLGLRAIARASPGADVFVMNDSVFGPFGELGPFFAAARWDLSGFTAFAMIENHIQSYAFLLRGVTPERLGMFHTTLPARFAFDRQRDVIYMQETRFAREAAKRMSVGALWYSDLARAGDPTLYTAVDLLEHGYPFMKRALFTKAAGIHDPALLAGLLRDRGHPPPL